MVSCKAIFEALQSDNAVAGLLSWLFVCLIGFVRFLVMSAVVGVLF